MFVTTHITKHLPLGIITEDTLASFDTNSNRHKYAPLIHHNIITAIYKRIWLTSRMISHDPIFPTPAPLQIPTLNKTKPLAPSLIEKKVLKYISSGQSSLIHLLED